jgi:hypothetical protein
MDQNIKISRGCQVQNPQMCSREGERERERETKRRKKCFCAFRLCAWNGPATLNVRFLPLLYFSTSSCFSLYSLHSIHSQSIQLWGLDQNGNLWNSELGLHCRNFPKCNNRATYCVRCRLEVAVKFQACILYPQISRSHCPS